MQLVQSGEETQQGRLPRPVHAGEQHDLARLDVQVDPGQGREPTQEAHGGTQADDDGHVSLHGLHRGSCFKAR